MIACFYRSFVLLLIVSFLFSSSYGHKQSSIYSIIFSEDDQRRTETKDDDDQYTSESKYDRASYQHEQAELANIYAPNRTYISMHDDRIHPSNFTYFTFKNRGTYRFILISLRGDADLYISTSHKHVSYDNYDFSSCTCGIDEILIDPYVKRPIYIGIYGYSQYQVSHYRLLVELVDATIPLDDLHDDPTTADQDTTQKNQKTSRVTSESRDDEQHLLWNILVWILNVLFEVLT
ncbi:unnamed protein product [Adineta ricciae]|uniref:Uncharacterized protein n=1 Tax=Adineta ricciae TaxID=249248 RepID=A0A813XF55_ADIRI|nr:unnamed protein product [Adineta ricciae]CAF1661825.1 unnamed protein product [Adineta ricciae]